MRWWVFTLISRWSLLLLGLLLFSLDSDAPKIPRYFVALGVGAAALAPPIRRRVVKLVERFRDPSPRGKWITFGVVFFLAAWYLVLSATAADRGLFPAYHDEYMYLLQARMLAGGRLWMPRHELAPFFDSFHIITTPVYAATYFPGTAIFYVPGVWLDISPWVTGIIITAMAIAMLYLVMTELLDGVAGILAAMLAVSLVQLRAFSIMTESHPAMLLLLLLAAWCCMRWRGTRSLGWAGAFGVCAGWAAITRPLDAVCLVGPLCLLVVWDALGASGGRRRIGKAAVAFAVVIAGAAPFLLLQLYFDKEVAGSYFQTPYTQYVHATFPGLDFGYHPRTVPEDSPSPLLQVRDYYRSYFRQDVVEHGRVPFVRFWLSKRLGRIADAAVPAHAIYILLPVGLLCLRRRPVGAALAVGVVSLPLAYAFYPSYLDHYALPCVAAFIMLGVGGEFIIRRSLLRAGGVLPVVIAALCIASLPEVRGGRDGVVYAPLLADVNAKLARLDHLPAVVLFHYDTGNSVHQEPVYNIHTIDPDEAAIIRAHDLGPDENRRIFAYYAERQPERFFYLYNRSTAELTPLGYARDLAKK